ncbi:MAG TPA: zinc ribbon domain-containing protein [Pyrinomonadaceae bacterium]
MSSHYLSTSTLKDHDLTLAIPGDIDSVRLRLINAIKTLGYKVLSEQPLHAKRGAQGAATWDCSMNALDYLTELTVSLKQMNDLAVVATFNYEIKSFIHLTKGDRQTLAREAQAIAALATERGAISACVSCGTQVTDESNFCRRCGAPLELDLAELEVLRLTRGTRSSYHYIFVGMLSLFLALLTVLPLFVVNGARIWAPMLWAGIPLASYAFINLSQGIWQLHQTLNPKAVNRTMRSQPTFTSSNTTALPPAPANASVIEGTTELLTSTSNHRSAERIRRRDGDTSEMDDERLM